MQSPTILILAGKRDGVPGPMADKFGVSHKCRIPIKGKPLLQWVLEGVEDAWPDSPILVSIHDPAVIADLPAVERLSKAGRLTITEAQPGIVESVEKAVEIVDQRFPLLITTGDNVLVTADLLHEVEAAARSSGASCVIGLAERGAVRAAHPQAQSNFYQFSDMAIANCNMYWLRDVEAMKAAEAFRAGGQFIRNMARIAGAFGALNLLRFKLGRWSLGEAMAAMSRRFGVRVHAHLIADGAYAVDVDNDRTYEIAELLLEKRKL